MRGRVARAPGRIARAGAIVIAAAFVGALDVLVFRESARASPEAPFAHRLRVQPPFQVRTDSGFSGLAVEIVNKAARRAGVTLQWIETGTSSEEAFRKGLVDLWPLMTDLPERHRFVHFTAPWVISNHVVLLRAESAVPDRAYTGRIALFKLPLHLRFVNDEYPRAQAVPFPDARDVLREVCRNNAAGFLEKRVAIIAMKDSPPECSIRFQNLADLSFKNSLASTFEAAGTRRPVTSRDRQPFS